jgi:hypothetical protein
VVIAYPVHPIVKHVSHLPLVTDVSINTFLTIEETAHGLLTCLSNTPIAKAQLFAYLGTSLSKGSVLHAQLIV